MVVVDKPAGFLVHRGPHSHKEPALLQALRDFLGCHVYPVHRLDRATSGAVIFALNPKSAAALQSSLQAPSCQKYYLALVHGEVLEPMAIHRPLTSASGKSQAAHTELWPLETLRHSSGFIYSLVRVRIYTGRQNQIRRHFNGIQHHVIGDTQFGKLRWNQHLRDELGCSRLMLHAHELNFEKLQNNSSPQVLLIQSPLPVDFKHAIGTLGFVWKETVHSGLPSSGL